MPTRYFLQNLAHLRIQTYQARVNCKRKHKHVSANTNKFEIVDTVLNQCGLLMVAIYCHVRQPQIH